MTFIWIHIVRSFILTSLLFNKLHSSWSNWSYPLTSTKEPLASRNTGSFGTRPCCPELEWLQNLLERLGKNRTSCVLLWLLLLMRTRQQLSDRIGCLSSSTHRLQWTRKQGQDLPSVFVTIHAFHFDLPPFQTSLFHVILIRILHVLNALNV